LEKSLLKARQEEARCWRVPGVGLRRLLRSRGGREEEEELEDLSLVIGLSLFFSLNRFSAS
jgi:hypothetical protein